jgi:hypothetical protein
MADHNREAVERRHFPQAAKDAALVLECGLEVRIPHL